jgi:hypothetical protein
VEYLDVGGPTVDLRHPEEGTRCGTSEQLEAALCIPNAGHSEDPDEPVSEAAEDLTKTSLPNLDPCRI